MSPVGLISLKSDVVILKHVLSVFYVCIFKEMPPLFDIS
jgi:hypothetical protein